MKAYTVALSLFASEAYAALPLQDLAGCQSFAKMFDNTCTKDGSGNGTAITDVDSWPSG